MLRVTPRSIIQQSNRLGLLGFTRLQSTTPPPKNDPLSFMANLGKADGKAMQDVNSISSFLGNSSYLRSKQKADSAYETATNLPLPGQFAGRTMITAKEPIGKSITKFDRLVRSNRIKEIYFEQRFFTKPNKRKLNKRIANKKKRFDAGIAQLFQVVRDAVRKGY